MSLFRYGRANRKVALLNDHRSIVDATDCAGEVGGAFELCFTVPTMSTPQAHLSKGKRPLSSLFWNCDIIEEASVV